MEYRRAINGKTCLTFAWLVIAFLYVAVSIWQDQLSLAKERAERNKFKLVLLDPSLAGETQKDLNAPPPSRE